jgi:hypothetical protein
VFQCERQYSGLLHGRNEAPAPEMQSIGLWNWQAASTTPWRVIEHAESFWIEDAG